MNINWGIDTSFIWKVIGNQTHSKDPMGAGISLMEEFEAAQEVGKEEGMRHPQVS